MASVNISIREDVYKALRRRKAGDESFSDVLERLLGQSGRLSDFLGVWEDMTEEEWRDIEARAGRRRGTDQARTARRRRSWG